MKTTGIYVKSGRRIVEKQIPLEEAVDMYKDNPSDFYSHYFFARMKRSKDWQIAVGKKIEEAYEFESVMDIGCAAGYYLEGILDGGAKRVLGLEYSYDNVEPFVSEDMKEFIQFGNAMEKIDHGQFDCCMSIEVAEHILQGKTDEFVDNLTSSSKDMIIFTAAPPGQRGTGHINEQPRDFWVKKFKDRGFKLAPADAKKIYKCFSKVPYRCKYMSCIQNQIMCYRREK